MCSVSAWVWRFVVVDCCECVKQPAAACGGLWHQATTEGCIWRKEGRKENWVYGRAQVPWQPA